MNDAFSYHSEQTHTAYTDGEGGTRRDIVHIEGEKGFKAVEFYGTDGSLISRVDKPLSQAELACICRHKFIPGLFKDCIESLNVVQASLKKSKRGTKKAKRGRSKRRR